MPIPIQSDTFAIVLGLMNDGKDHSRPQLCNQVAVKFDLSPEELSMKTKSKAYVYKSRVNWGVSYLSRAMMLSKVSRGVYRINNKGRNALENGLTDTDFFQGAVKDEVITVKRFDESFFDTL